MSALRASLLDDGIPWHRVTIHSTRSTTTTTRATMCDNEDDRQWETARVVLPPPGLKVCHCLVLLLHSWHHLGSRSFYDSYLSLRHSFLFLAREPELERVSLFVLEANETSMRTRLAQSRRVTPLAWVLFHDSHMVSVVSRPSPSIGVLWLSLSSTPLALFLAFPVPHLVFAQSDVNWHLHQQCEVNLGRNPLGYQHR